MVRGKPKRMTSTIQTAYLGSLYSGYADEPLSMLCGKCADETLKSKNITTECVFRFGPTAQLREQFDRVRARFSE